MIYEATSEVSGAILTAVLTTIISFIPVFTMIGAEGKLFRPLAFTKTFALAASLLVALFLIPPFAAFLFRKKNIHKTGQLSPARWPWTHWHICDCTRLLAGIDFDRFCAYFSMADFKIKFQKKIPLWLKY